MVKQSIEDRFSDLSNYISLEFGKLVGRDWEEKVRREGLRSAVAAILSRVMAHDLGSHMLVHAKLSDGQTDEKLYFEHLKEYLRHRMVFIAEATSGEPSFTTSVGLKTQVLEPFEWCRRPSEEKEVEGIKVEPIKSAVCKNIALSNEVDDITLRLIPEGDNQAYVEIPGGVVGCQALYCIFENVIRNGAKFGKAVDQKLKLNIRLDEKPDHYRVLIWDDHSMFCKSAYEDILSYFPPACWNGISIPADKQERWHFIDEHGSLVGHGLGFKEMRICAAWLKCAPLWKALEDEEERDAELLLRPVIVDVDGIETDAGDNRAKFIGYEFSVLKSKEALLVGPAINDNLLSAGDAVGADRVPEPSSAFRALPVHSSCVVALPKKADERKQWLSSLKERRTELPTVLVCASDDESCPIPPASVRKPFESYADLSRRQGEELASAVNGLYYEWAKDVLCMEDGLKLVVHLESASKGVVELWEETAGQLTKLCEDSRWTMEVTISSQRLTHAGKQTLLFDRHEDHIKEEAFKRSDFGFYEPFFGVCPQSVTLLSPPVDPMLRLRLALELLISAWTRVAVIDERVWGARKYIVERHTFEEYSKSSRLFIPEVEVIDLEHPEPEHLPALDAWLDPQENTAAEVWKPVKMLVVHYGTLDRLFSDPSEISSWIDRLRSEFKIPLIVVESDRGESFLPGLPRSVAFVPYSSVERWIVSSRSKFHLVHTLLRARRRPMT